MLVILRVVEALGFTIPPTSSLSRTVYFLWANNKSGLFDGVYVKWDPARMDLQIKLRVDAILSRYHDFDDEYPSELQVIAKNLFDERSEAAEKADNARAVAEALEEVT